MIDLALRKNELFRLRQHPLPKLDRRNIYLTAPGEVAVLDLVWPQGQPDQLQLKKTVRLLTEFPPEPQVQQAVRSHSARLEQLLGEEIGITRVALDTHRLLVRSEENALANLVVDAMRQHAGADVGLVNAGNIRGEKQYPAGASGAPFPKLLEP